MPPVARILGRRSQESRKWAFNALFSTAITHWTCSVEDNKSSFSERKTNSSKIVQGTIQKTGNASYEDWSNVPPLFSYNSFRCTAANGKNFQRAKGLELQSAECLPAKSWKAILT